MDNNSQSRYGNTFRNDEQATESIKPKKQVQFDINDPTQEEDNKYGGGQFQGQNGP